MQDVAAECLTGSGVGLADDSTGASQVKGVFSHFGRICIS